MPRGHDGGELQTYRDSPLRLRPVTSDAPTDADHLVRDLLAGGSESRLDYKSARWAPPEVRQRASLAKHVIGLSNRKDGGYLLIGVQDSTLLVIACPGIPRPPRTPRPPADTQDQPRLALEPSLPDLLAVALCLARTRLTSNNYPCNTGRGPGRRGRIRCAPRHSGHRAHHPTRMPAQTVPGNRASAQDVLCIGIIRDPIIS
jgi:hypothetical protein